MSITITDLYNFLTHEESSIKGIKVESTFETRNQKIRSFIQYHYYNTKYHKSLKYMIASGYRKKNSNRYIQESVHAEIRIIDNCVYNCIHFEGPMTLLGYDLKNVFIPFESALRQKYINDDLRALNYDTVSHKGGMIFEIKCFNVDESFTKEQQNKLKQTTEDLFECLESVLP